MIYCFDAICYNVVKGTEDGGFLAHHYVFFGEPGGILHPAGHCRDEEQRSHTPDKHHAADDYLAHDGKLAREAHGEPAGTVGAHDLEQDLQEGHAALVVEAGTRRDFGNEQHHGGKRDDHDGHHEDSHRLVDRGFGNGTAQHLGLFAPEQAVEPEKPDDRRRGDLDAAAAAAGVCADEHDDDKEEQRTDAKGGGVYRVEAGGTAREGHEHRGLELVEEAEPVERVAPFGEHEGDDACPDDDERAEGGDAGMQRQLAELLLLEVEGVLQFGDGEEPETAREGEDAGRDVHDGVQLELHQRIREHREPDVTERTDGLEQRAEKAVVHFHAGKLREVEYPADGLQDEREGQHRHEDALRVDVALLREVGEQYGLVVESWVHAREQDEHRRYRHDTEAAQLHEDDEHPVAETRESGTDIDDREARDAHGGRGREERLQEVDGFACRYGQPQQDGTQGYDCEVTEHHQRDGVRLLLRLEHVFGRGVRERLVLGT